MLHFRKLRNRILRGSRARASVLPAVAPVATYWEKRYAAGGTSGAGSAGRLAEFKAKVLNKFVEAHGVKNVLELGCGDGKQLALARYPSYVGVDVSQIAVNLCRRQFEADASKRFFHASERVRYAGQYDLVLSLDVVFHLVEDPVYEAYIFDVKRFAGDFIIIYSSNYDENPERPWAPHVRHRRFSDSLEKPAGCWTMYAKINNPYPYDARDPENTSFSDFYIYKRIGHPGIKLPDSL